MFMLVKNQSNMNSSDILDKTLAWLHSTKQDAAISTRIFSYFLQPIGGKTMLQLAFPVRNNGRYRYNFDQENDGNAYPINRSYSDLPMATPQEVEDLTQIILHTLNSDPDRFHDMAEIPGLETKEWMQRMELARFLLKQGLIEANTRESMLSIKLTIKGTMYLRSHESAA